MNPQTIGLTELQKHPADTCCEKGWDKVWSMWSGGPFDKK
ncbi:hypothetical protein NLML1_0777 [Candidatus Nanosynbacter lyticus]|nr:hypothetical protein NLML1_0777 [Candidatus Nanosynbacter lyticus]